MRVKDASALPRAASAALHKLWQDSCLVCAKRGITKSAIARTVKRNGDCIMDAGSKLAQSQRMGVKVARIYQKRVQKAQEQFQQRVQQIAHDTGTNVPTVDPLGGYRYAVDAVQRSLLFWETLWQRGTNFVEHNAQGLKPVLHFDYEFVVDGRQLERPVNYALLSITPPEA